MVDVLNINFDPVTFWCILCVLPTLEFVNLIDTNMCKVLILCEMFYFCEIFM